MSAAIAACTSTSSTLATLLPMMVSWKTTVPPAREPRPANLRPPVLKRDLKTNFVSISLADAWSLENTSPPNAVVPILAAYCDGT